MSKSFGKVLASPSHSAQKPERLATSEITERARTIMRLLVEAYVESGQPIGSRKLVADLNLSASTIRNELADLEDIGLLRMPHISAGRVPTALGLRFFVEGLLQIQRLGAREKKHLQSLCAADGRRFDTVLEEISCTLSGLARSVGFVYTPKRKVQFQHVEFVYLSRGRALAVLVDKQGVVENRLIDLPEGITQDILERTGQFLNRHLQHARARGEDFSAMRNAILEEIDQRRASIDALSRKMIEAGVATMTHVGAGESPRKGSDSSSEPVQEAATDSILIVRGRANLIEDMEVQEHMEAMRKLLQTLENRESMLKLLEATMVGEGVHVYIGAKDGLFTLSGCSAVVAPFAHAESGIAGAIGVIGPMRMNYMRIVSLVDYTSLLIERLLSSEKGAIDDACQSKSGMKS